MHMRKARRGFWLTVGVMAILSFVLFTSSCKSKEKTSKTEGTKGKTKGTVIAKIGGKYEVTWEEFTDTYRLDPNRKMSEETLNRLLDNYINQYLVYLEGIEKGYDKNPEIVEQIERTKRQLISRYVVREISQKPAEISEQQMREYYDTNNDSFQTTEINYLVFYNRKYENNPQKARKAAEEALSSLKKGEEFMKVAERVYDRKNPNINMSVRKNQKSFYGQNFDEAVWSVPVGEFSNVIETTQGFMVFKVNRREILTYEQAQPFIRSDLMHTTGMNQVEAYYNQLRKKYPVAIQEETLKAKVAPFTQSGTPPAQPSEPSEETTPHP